jgi:hypothetical protein
VEEWPVKMANVDVDLSKDYQCVGEEVIIVCGEEINKE